MRKLALLIFTCMLAAFFSADAAVAMEKHKRSDPAAQKQQTVKPMKAKPVGKPNSVGTREKLSATGYFDKEQDEPTQERPNPVDAKGIKDPAGATNPARAHETPAPR